MKRIVVLAALALLAAPGAAQAKELAWAKVCGGAGCTEIKLPPNDLLAGGDGVWEAAPPASPYYSVELHVRDGNGGIGNSWTVYFVPSTALLGLPGEHGGFVWDALEPDALAAFRSVTGGMKPFSPASSSTPSFAAAPSSHDDTWPLAGGALVAVGALGLAAFLLYRRRSAPPLMPEVTP